MSGDPQRLIAHLQSQLNILQQKLATTEGLVGPANLRYIAVKDQYEAHMAEPHYMPGHAPMLAPVTLIEGGWGVFCQACSEEKGDYVNPCLKLGPDDPWPPPVIVPKKAAFITTDGATIVADPEVNDG